MDKFKKIFNLLVLILIPLLVLFTIIDVLEISYKTDFNKDNIKEHVEKLSETTHSLYDDEGNTNAFNYIKNELEQMGLANDDNAFSPSYLTQQVMVEDIDVNARNLYQGLYGSAEALGSVIYHEPYEINNIVALLPANSGNRSGDAIMIMAHYDSVPMGPGASDDGVAISVMLEAIRYYLGKMNEGYTFDNDIVFVFTDGEEFGLYGASIFMGNNDYEPFKGFDNIVDRIKFAINLESRGTSGTLIMFETSPKNFKTVQLFAKINKNIFTSSIANLVYQSMPNGTDFSEYNNVYQGLNFANLGAGYNYHTQNDKYDNVGDTYLSQQAMLVDDVICTTSSMDLTTLYGANGDAVFFSYINLGTVYYSKGVASGLGVVAVILFIGLIVMSVIKKSSRIANTALGYVVIVLSMIGSGLVTFLLYYVYSFIASLFGVIDGHAIGKVEYSHLAIVLSIVLLSFVITALVSYLIQKMFKISGKDTRKAMTYLVSVIGIALSFVLPEASYLFAIPAILFLTIEILGIFCKKTETLHLGIVAFGIAFSLIYPAISLASDALGLNMSYVFAVLAAMLALMVVPTNLDAFKYVTLAKVKELFKKADTTPRPLCGIINMLGLTLIILLVISISKTNISVNYQGKQSIPYLPYDDALVYHVNGDDAEYIVKDLDAYTYIKDELNGFTFDQNRQAYFKRDTFSFNEVSGLSSMSLVDNVLSIDRKTSGGYIDIYLTEIQNLDSVEINYGTYTKTYTIGENKSDRTIRIRHDATIKFIMNETQPQTESFNLKCLELLINYEPLKSYNDFQGISKIEQAKYNLIYVTNFE